MPYIITTIIYEGQRTPTGETKVAVATLEEAQAIAWETCKDISGPNAATSDDRTACESIPEEGDTIGPLADRTLIRVEPSDLGGKTVAQFNEPEPAADARPMTDHQAHQAWWDSMTDDQREAYQDAIARRRAEREVGR